MCVKYVDCAMCREDSCVICLICFALGVFPADLRVYSAGFWGYRAKQPTSNFRLAGHLSRNGGSSIRKKILQLHLRRQPIRQTSYGHDNLSSCCALRGRCLFLGGFFLCSSLICCLGVHFASIGDLANSHDDFPICKLPWCH
jgi:hypothetical protein